MAFCSGCGAQMADGATICAACGKGQSVGGGAAAAPAASQSGGLADNVAGLLSYLFIPAIIFLVMEPYNKSKFIRFHAFQGLFLGLASIAGHIVLGIIPVLGWFILPFFSLAIFIIAVIAAIKAYGNQKWMIPGIGPLAETQANQ
jgi:uncharacterized membrane protein